MYISAWNSPHVQSKLVWWMSVLKASFRKSYFYHVAQYQPHVSTQHSVKSLNVSLKDPPGKVSCLHLFCLPRSVSRKTLLSPNWPCCNPYLGTSSGTAEMFFCLDYKAQDQNVPLFSEQGIKAINACIPKCCTERWVMWRLENMTSSLSLVNFHPKHPQYGQWDIFLSSLRPDLLSTSQQDLVLQGGFIWSCQHRHAWVK